MLRDELNKNPFIVPENYFDRLPAQVQQRFTSQQKASLWSTTLKPRLAYVAGLGALALFTYGGISLIERNNGSNTNMAANRRTPLNHNSFINNNAKTYAQFTNDESNPLIHIVNNNSTPSNDNKTMDDAIIDYLAIENISADDILGLE